MPAHSDSGLLHSARLTFVDRRGLSNLDLANPKLGLHKEVKALEATMNGQAKPAEPRPELNLAVLSPTKFSDLFERRRPGQEVRVGGSVRLVHRGRAGQAPGQDIHADRVTSG